MKQRTCTVEDCESPTHCRGWCKAHYERWRRYGNPQGRPAVARDSECKVEGCPSAAKTRGWCSRHYDRWLRHGDPEAGRTPRGTWTDAVCSVEECARPTKAHGWCQQHYRRWRQHGDPLGGRAAPGAWQGKTCKAESCGEPPRGGQGWCKRHYQKWYRTGNAEAPDERSRRGAPLRERIESSVAKTDHCWFWLKHLNQDGYGAINIEGRHVGAHRASYMAFVGPIPDGMVIDHLCRNRACVNPQHLEAVTHTVNVRRGDSAVRKDRCGNDHEYTKENTRWVRVCVTCSTASRERWKARK